MLIFGKLSHIVALSVFFGLFCDCGKKCIQISNLRDDDGSDADDHHHHYHHCDRPLL
jgi:hypothetical protein